LAKQAQPTVSLVDPTTLPAQTAGEFLARGWLFYARQKFDLAIADFKNAVEKDPKDPDTWYALGLALKGAGSVQQALDTFSKMDPLIADMQDHQRATIISRLVHGQINQIKTGNWNLEKEVWEKAH
jgi:tetratricopeptide (TPR) repeat protein